MINRSTSYWLEFEKCIDDFICNKSINTEEEISDLFEILEMENIKTHPYYTAIRECIEYVILRLTKENINNGKNKSSFL